MARRAGRQGVHLVRVSRDHDGVLGATGIRELQAGGLRSVLSGHLTFVPDALDEPPRPAETPTADEARPSTVDVEMAPGPALVRLQEVLPPPEPAIETGSATAWASVEEDLGLALPSDYKQFIARYGTGSIDRSLVVFNPFARFETLRLDRRNLISRQIGPFRLHREEEGMDVPYPLYPEPGGLLPWGRTTRGGFLFWITVGDPDGWTVVVGDEGGYTHQPLVPAVGPNGELRWSEFSGTLTECLLSMVQGRYRPLLLSGEVFSPEPSFHITE